MINHGTSGGYYAHLRLSEPACESCRNAVNKYLREYRASNKGDRIRTRDQIRRKALARLRDRHRDEYEALIDEVEIQVLGELEASEE